MKKLLLTFLLVPILAAGEDHYVSLRIPPRSEEGLAMTNIFVLARGETAELIEVVGGSRGTRVGFGDDFYLHDMSVDFLPSFKRKADGKPGGAVLDPNRVINEQFVVWIEKEGLKFMAVEPRTPGPAGPRLVHEWASIAGPATIHMVGNGGSLKIKITSSVFGPDEPLILPISNEGRSVVETSPDSMQWTTATNLGYAYPVTARFFRIRLEALPTRATK